MTSVADVNEVYHSRRQSKDRLLLYTKVLDGLVVKVRRRLVLRQTLVTFPPRTGCYCRTGKAFFKSFYDIFRCALCSNLDLCLMDIGKLHYSGKNLAVLQLFSCLHCFFFVPGRAMLIVSCTPYTAFGFGAVMRFFLRVATGTMTWCQLYDVQLIDFG